MRINDRQLRQIIREELQRLNENPSILSGYSAPIVTPDKKNITIITTDGRKATSTNVGARIIFDASYLPNTTLPITDLQILTWTPEVADGLPFMKVKFVVRGETKEANLKNKVALKRIADAILTKSKAEGEPIRITDSYSAALIVNY